MLGSLQLKYLGVSY